MTITITPGTTAETGSAVQTSLAVTTPACWPTATCTSSPWSAWPPRPPSSETRPTTRWWNSIPTLGGTGNTILSLYQRKATGTVGAGTATFTWSGAQTGRIAAVPFLVQGADTTTPIQTSAFDDTSFTAPTVTADAATDYLLTVFGARGPAGDATAFDLTGPVGMTAIGEKYTTTASSSQVGVLVAGQQLSGTGATGAKTATVASGTAPGHGGIAVLLNTGAGGITHNAAAALTATAIRSATPSQVTAVAPTFVVGGLGIDDDVRALPTPPTNVQVTPGDRRLDVTWAPPASAGDGTVRSYALTLTSATESPRNATVVLPSTLAVTFNTLTNGTQYYLSLRAISEYGEGTAATTSGVPAVPSRVPEPVTGLVTKGLDRALAVQWTAPMDTGTQPITGYRVVGTQAGLAAPVQMTVDAGVTATILFPLYNDAAVSVSVYALSAAGSSLATVGFGVPTATPAGETVPGPVVALAVIGRDGGFEASWQAPASAGSRAVTGYEVRATNNTSGVVTYYLVRPDVTSAKFTSLPNNALYTVAVYARSPAGYSPAASAALDLFAPPTPLPYPRVVGAGVSPVLYSTIEQNPYVPPVADLPPPIWYAFPPGAVFAPASFGVDAAAPAQPAPTLPATKGHIAELAIAEGQLQGGNWKVARSIRLTPSFGPVWYTDMDLGYPSFDEVVTPFMNANGTFDETKYHRSRAVGISLKVLDHWFPDVRTGSWDQRWSSSWYWLRELGRWCVPDKRYRLYWRTAAPDSTSYWTDLRGDSIDAPVVMGAREYRDVQLNFISPSGRIYQMDESPPPGSTLDGRRVHQVPFGGLEAGGITFPIAADGAGNLLDFPGISYGSGAPLRYDGTASTGFLAQVFADPALPLYNPKITVTAPSGKVSSIGFQGLEVDAGQMVEIDSIAMTVTMMAPPFESGDSVEQYLIGPLTWPQLEPGDNAFDFTINPNVDTSSPALPGDGAHVDISYYPAFLG